MILFAPMEGVTDSVFRKVHHECFTGVDAYFTPFLSPTQNMTITSREKKNIYPEYTAGVPTVPQVLAKEPQLFLWMAQVFADLGYTEVNLNAGCPSGTVTSKQKGSGMLRNLDMLDHFLEEVCEISPLPVSVKTRIGFYEPEEWGKLLEVYRKYPLKRLIIHPRTCGERYKPGTVHIEAFEQALENVPWPVVYNGDLFSTSQARDAAGRWKNVSQLMIGRGLVCNPTMARELKGGEPVSLQELIHFHDRLVEEYSRLYPDDQVFMKLRMIMKHIDCCFDDAEKAAKAIRRSRSLADLLAADRMLFETCPLSQEPIYVP